MYLSALAGKDVGPLDHDDGDEIARLGVEDGFSSEGDLIVADGGFGSDELVGPVEHEGVGSCGLVAVKVDPAQIDLVVQGRDPVGEVVVGLDRGQGAVRRQHRIVELDRRVVEPVVLIALLDVVNIARRI